MFCFNCGQQNTDHIRYCTRCGANLDIVRQAVTNPIHPTESGKPVKLILILSALIAIFGFAIVFALLIPLANSPIGNSDLSPLLAFLGLGGIAGVCFMVWQLLKMIAKEPRNLSAPMQMQNPPAMYPAQNMALPPPSASSYSSVVEHTTANLKSYAPPMPEEQNR